MVQSPADTNERPPRSRQPALSDEQRRAPCRRWLSPVFRLPRVGGEQCTQAVRNAPRVEFARSTARDHHEVEPVVALRQAVPRASKPLAYGPLHPVAHHCVAHLSTRRNAQTHPVCRLGSPGSDEHHELARSQSASPRCDASIVARCSQSIRPRKTAGPRCDHPYLEGVDGARRFRPFALRRLRIVRPPAVFMRERKPCLRRRRIRLGW